jgi:oligopeptidase B
MSALKAALGPIAKQVPHQVSMHGALLDDNYAWMRDKSNADLIPHLKAENTHAECFMADTLDLQDQLFHEIRARIKEADETVPSRRGEWLYFERTEEDKQYPIYCRRHVLGGDVEVMLDVNEIAGSAEFTSVEGLEVSPDGKFLAFRVDQEGNEKYVLGVKDLRTGRCHGIAECVTSCAWASDSQTLLYTTADEQTNRSYRLFRHNRGRHYLMREEKDELLQILVRRSRSGRFIYLDTTSHTTATSSYIPSDQPHAPLTDVVPLTPNVKCTAEDDGRQFFVLTNDGAKDFRIIAAPCDRLDQWQEVVAHRKGTQLVNHVVLKDCLIVHEQAGVPLVRVQQISTGTVRYIAFPDPMYDVTGLDNFEFDTKKYRLEYSSLVTPPSTLEYDLGTGALVTLKETEVGGYEKERYKCERIYATAEDGTQVPISLVYKDSVTLDGRQFLHLYGYGAYGSTINPYFSIGRLSLLNRGFVYAYAHVRGGGELGEGWWEGGKLEHKMNTFTDFIACARHLIALGYTTSDRLTIEGRSAGGLLMGAVLNLAPDLAAGAILGVPFLDVLNTMLDESLPLTTGEFKEWGNPKVKKDWDIIRAYSPYDNIARTDYPAILVRSSLNDSRVGFWEPAKWTAKLREMKTDKNPLIFKILLEAGGHGGHSGRFDALRDIAHDYAFIIKVHADRNGWPLYFGFV